MLPYLNKTEAQSHIAEFLEASKCYFSFVSTGYQKEIGITILGSPLYLGQFNRLVKTRSSYTFSYLLNEKIEPYKKSILKSIDQSGIDSKYYQMVDNSNEVLPFSEQGIGICDSFIQSIFSAEFIEENKLFQGEIESELEISRTLQKDKIEVKESITHLRWEEVRDDLRVVLSISPIDGSIQLSFCFLYQAYQRGLVIQDYNPVTAHFVERFRYEGRRFERYISKHDLNFQEVQGYEYYPENDLNQQLFEIKYNVISEGAFDEIAQKSFRSLKRETKPIMSLLHLVYGNDIYGNTSFELPVVDLHNSQSELHELMKGMLGSLLKDNQAVIGKLHYHSPENDIHLAYSPVQETDDSGNEFIVFSLSIKVVPFNSNPPAITGTYYHPVIYDAEK